MFSFLAHFYGMSIPDIKALPIRLFFALYNEGAKMEVRQYRELLRIQAISIFKYEYYEQMRDNYDRVINPEVAQLPEKPLRPAMDMRDTSTKNAVIGFFSPGRRGG